MVNRSVDGIVRNGMELYAVGGGCSADGESVIDGGPGPSGAAGACDVCKN